MTWGSRASSGSTWTAHPPWRGRTDWRIEDSGWLGWAVAFAVMGVLLWREAIHPMILLIGGAAIFLAVRAAMG